MAKIISTHNQAAPRLKTLLRVTLREPPLKVYLIKFTLWNQLVPKTRTKKWSELVIQVAILCMKIVLKKQVNIAIRETKKKVKLIRLVRTSIESREKEMKL